MDSVDSFFSRVLREFRNMEARLMARIEGHDGGFEPRAAVAIFNEEHAGDEGPIFDEEPLIDVEPVFDVPQQQPDSSHIVIALSHDSESSSFHDIGDAPLFDTVSDDLDKGPVFDSYSDDLGGELVFDFYSDDLGRGPIVDKELTLGPRVLLDAHNQDLLEQARNTMVSRNIDTDTHARVLNHICQVFHQGYSSIGDRGELFLDTFELLSHVHGVAAASKLEMRSVISGPVATDGCEVITCWDPGLPDVLAFIEIARSGTDFAPAYYVVAVDGIQQEFWDPGSSEVPKFTRFGVNFGFGVDFLWDPGLLEDSQFIEFADFDPAHYHELYIEGFVSKLWDPGLAQGSKFIELTGSGAALHSAKLCWLALNWLMQQKCSGAYKIASSPTCIPAPNDLRAHGLDCIVCWKSEDPACVQLQFSVCYWCNAFTKVALEDSYPCLHLYGVAGQLWVSLSDVSISISEAIEVVVQLPMSAHLILILTQGMEKHEYWSHFKQAVQLLQHKQWQITFYNCLSVRLLVIEGQKKFSSLDAHYSCCANLYALSQWSDGAQPTYDDEVHATEFVQSEHAWQFGNWAFLDMMPVKEDNPHTAGYELLLKYGKAGLVRSDGRSVEASGGNVHVVLQGMSSVIHWILMSAWLYNSQVVSEQWSFLMSKAAVQGEQFPKPRSIRNPIHCVEVFTVSSGVDFTHEISIQLILGGVVVLNSDVHDYFISMICTQLNHATDRCQELLQPLVISAHVGQFDLVSYDARISLDIFDDYSLALSGVCCVGGELIVHKILMYGLVYGLVISALEIQLQLLISDYLAILVYNQVIDNDLAKASSHMPSLCTYVINAQRVLTCPENRTIVLNWPILASVPLALGPIVPMGSTYEKAMHCLTWLNFKGQKELVFATLSHSKETAAEFAARRRSRGLLCLDWMPPHSTTCKLLLQCAESGLLRSDGTIKVDTYGAYFHARSGIICVHGELAEHKGLNDMVADMFVLIGYFLQQLGITDMFGSEGSTDLFDAMPLFCQYVDNEQEVLACSEKMENALTWLNSNVEAEWNGSVGLEETEVYFQKELLEDKQRQKEGEMSGTMCGQG